MDRTTLLLTALFLPSLCIGAEFEDIHKTYKAGEVAVFDIATIASEVDLTAGDKDTLELDIVKSNKEAFHWDIELKDSKLTVQEKSKKMFNRGSNQDCRVTVKVPKDLAVQLASVSGDLKAAGLSKGVEAHTTSGAMDIALSAGEARLSSVSGDAKALGLTGGLVFESVSGELDAKWASYPEKAAVRLKTVSGDLDLTLPKAGKVALEFDSVSGKMKADGFTLDSSAFFSVDAGTVSGDLTLKGLKR